jgi:hypothetical protein
MRPIVLTRVLESGKTEPFYINPAQIVSFGAGWKDIGAYITLTTGGAYAVQETPAQIIGRLADHRSSTLAEQHDGVEVYRS